MQEAANMTLWCKRGDRTFKFTVLVGIPTKIEDGFWECEWSLGDLLHHKGVPLKNINSMIALLGTMRFVTSFLKGCGDKGDLFYLDESLTEPIDNIWELCMGLDPNAQE